METAWPRRNRFGARILRPLAVLCARATARGASAYGGRLVSDPFAGSPPRPRLAIGRNLARRAKAQFFPPALWKH